MLSLAAREIVVSSSFKNSSQHSGRFDVAGDKEENWVRGGNRVICVGRIVDTVLLPVKIC
jgi:hypothetical protein